MLKTELLELVANGEGSAVEFKRDDCRPEQLAREIVAMINHNGGVIVLGVEDDGSISGIQNENLEEWIMDAVVARKVHPQILPSYQEILIDADRRVAILSFTQGVSKPYVLRHNGREDIFIRVGSTTRLTSREQRARLFSLGGMLHPESLPISGTSIDSLDTRRIEDYLRNVLRDPDMPSSKEERVRRLLDLGFLTGDVMGSPVCTLSGLLLFGDKPRRHLKQAGIRVMVFDGTEKDYKPIIDEVVDMPMVGLWRLEQNDTRTLLSEGIADHVIQMLKPFLTEEGIEIGQSISRQRTWHYPREAIREVIMNAIAHRDWTRTIDIEITRYSDRMEVISPGAMQNSMSVEKMKAGQRLPRNILIVDVLKDYGYIDARGMGVRTKVIPLMKQANGSEPEFESTDDYLKTVLYRKHES